MLSISNLLLPNAVQYWVNILKSHKQAIKTYQNDTILKEKPIKVHSIVGHFRALIM